MWFYSSHFSRPSTQSVREIFKVMCIWSGILANRIAQCYRKIASISDSRAYLTIRTTDRQSYHIYLDSSGSYSSLFGVVFPQKFFFVLYWCNRHFIISGMALPWRVANKCHRLMAPVQPFGVWICAIRYFIAPLTWFYIRFGWFYISIK